MMKSFSISWGTFAKGLQVCGGVGYFAVFIIQIAQLAYYSYRRPTYPIPQRGWTLQLPWTHIVYGSAHDADQILRLGSYLWPSAGLVAVGVVIEKLAAKSRQTVK